MCFDVLHATTVNNSKQNNGRIFKDQVETPNEYRKLLRTAGFKKIRLADVTTECLDGFRKHTEGYLMLMELSGETEKDMLQKMRYYLLGYVTSTRQCLLISGYKQQEKTKKQ